jgi:hypothetical protein
MKLWRCTHCGTDFEAEEFYCEKCDLDPKADPRLEQFAQELVVLHYEPPSRFRGLGIGRIACNLNASVAGLRRTGDPLAVNCSRCKETEQFKRDYRTVKVLPEYDMELGLDEKTQTIVRMEKEAG